MSSLLSATNFTASDTAALQRSASPLLALPKSHSPNEMPLLLKALAGEPLERPPVWFMRQAGRYMHEYQTVRQRASFLEICKTPDIAIEVTLQPLKAFGFDASIIFSDILIPLEAMGLHLEVTDAKGPQFADPLRHNDDLKRFHSFDPAEATPFLQQALQGMRYELQETGITLIGFAGAPWTLASYAVEGTSWKTGTHLKRWIMEDPKAMHGLMQQITLQIEAYLRFQADAGAQVLMLFDTWAGQCPEPWYNEWIQPYHTQLVQALKASHPQVPVILFAKQARNRLVPMKATGAACVGVDEMLSMAEARKLLGAGTVLQGNLDSSALFIKQPDVLKALVKQTLQEAGPSHHIFNLGHGVLPQTPRENVALVVEWVRQWRHSSQGFAS
jgi:uroporphyrinogen decarboxylase